MTSLGKYTLVRKLAAGGMAEVFLARTDGPAGFSKMQVVKRILPHLSGNEEFVSMFLNEARLAALLNHPNVIQIFELGQEQGTYFIAMELVDGTNLRSLARAAHAKAQFLPFEVVLKVISLACEGLAYAHEFVDETGRPLELVHRDISPDNVLISRQGAVKIADFGIAKAANLPHVTKAGILKGKISYMPPEQLKEIPLDRRADVFALGVVLHEALASKKPFASTSEVSAMQAILNEAPHRLAEMRPDLPPELQVIIDKALAKDREQRYADCRALQADIDQFLVDRGLSVRGFDIARVVGQYIPPASLTSNPATPAISDEALAQAGTPPPGTSSDRVGLELHPSQVIGVEDAAAATQTGPKPVPGGASEREPSQGAAPGLRRFTETEYSTIQDLPAIPRLPPSPARKWVAVVLVGGALAAGAGWRLRPAEPSGPPVHPPPPQTLPLAVAPPVAATTLAAVVPPPVPTPPPPAVTAPAVVAAPIPALAPAVASEPAPGPHHGAKKHHPHDPPTVAAGAPIPAAAAPAVATAAEQGSLMLRVAPWAEVEIDGRPYGMTPMPPVNLPAGTHSVRLKNSELPADRSMSVDIKSGAQATLRVNLALPR